MKKDRTLQIILLSILFGLFSCSSKFDDKSANQVDTTQVKIHSGNDLDETEDSSKTQLGKLRKIYTQAISDYIIAVNNPKIISIIGSLFFYLSTYPG